MEICFLSFLTFLLVSYLVYSVKKSQGVPESLSATYYTIGNKGWIFQIVMALTGILLLPLWLYLSEEKLQILVFLSCGGLLFTAAAPAFRLELEGKVHYSAAVVCCTSAVLWQVISDLWDVTLLFALLGWMLYLQFGKWCWWLECAVIGSVFSNLWRLAL